MVISRERVKAAWRQRARALAIRSAPLEAAESSNRTRSGPSSIVLFGVLSTSVCGRLLGR
jgi:hypothetical protein